MNTFKKLLILFVLLVSTSTNAQVDESYGENPDECKQRLSILSTYYKQKAYLDAGLSFRYLLKNCPRASKNIYIIGNLVLEAEIKQAPNDTVKGQLIDSLLLLQDLRLKYFPGKDPNKIRSAKAIYLLKYKLKTHYTEAFSLLDTAFTTNPAKLKPYQLKMYMYCYKLVVKSKVKNCDQLITAYLSVLQEISKKEQAGKTVKEKTKSKINSYAETCLDCDILDSLFQKGFESKKADTLWLDNGIDVLSRKKCNTSTALLMLLEERITSKPNAKTASTLGKYYVSKQDYPKAKTYIEQSISLEKDSVKSSKYRMVFSKYYLQQKKYSKAITQSKKAILLNKKNYNAYMTIGDAYASSSSSCKTLTFAGKELFWLAVDYYNKAASHAKDQKRNNKAYAKAKKYSKYFPEKGQLFLKSLKNGDKYTVKCTLSEATIVRSKK